MHTSIHDVTLTCFASELDSALTCTEGLNFNLVEYMSVFNGWALSPLTSVNAFKEDVSNREDVDKIELLDPAARSIPVSV